MNPFSDYWLLDGDKICHSKLSCNCMVVENDFGIMINRYGCLLTTMTPNPDTIAAIETQIAGDVF